MTVYVVEDWYDYECCCVRAVFTTLDAAKDYAMTLREPRYYDRYPRYRTPRIWEWAWNAPRNEPPHWHSNGICIYEMEVR